MNPRPRNQLMAMDRVGMNHLPPSASLGIGIKWECTAVGEMGPKFREPGRGGCTAAAAGSTSRRLVERSTS